MKTVKTSAKMLFHFKTKAIPFGQNVRTVVLRDENYPEVIHITKKWVARKEDKEDLEKAGLRIAREGNKYLLVFQYYQIQESSLRMIMAGLKNPSDTIFEIKI